METTYSVLDALPPPAPGRLVRGTRLLPGTRVTERQIAAHHDHWRAEGRRALASGRPVFVALGDSLAQAVGVDDPNDGWVAATAGLIGDPGGGSPDGGDERPGIVNLARSGARIADVLDAQLPVLAALPNEVCAVACTVGSNDLVRSPLGHRRALDALTAALPTGAVVATVPEVGSLAARVFNRHLRASCAARQLPVADVAVRLRRWRGRHAADRFHPNEAGYRLWVEAMAAALELTADVSGAVQSEARPADTRA